MSRELNINLEVTSAAIKAKGFTIVSVNLKGVDICEIMGQIKISDVLEHFNEEDILNAIGVDKVKRHFNLIKNKGK